MTPLIGVSSSSMPWASAPELLRAAAAMGAECVDLRADRGQGWEPEFDLIANTLPVAFVGAGARLGAGVPNAPLPRPLMRALLERGIALRLFIDPLDDVAALSRVADDVDRLRGTWGPDLRLAVELHDAAPTLLRLEEVLVAHWIGVVLDTLGLVRLRAGLGEARRFVHGHAVAVQVKGLALRDSAHRHVALAAAPRLAAWTAALVADARVPVTVETKAGTAEEDIRTLRRAISHLDRPTSPHALPEESPCACAS
jgi:hypothetical protein